MDKEQSLVKREKSELKSLDLDSRLNLLRAGVLGANDGIVSVAGVVIGVAAATGNDQAVLIAGVAAILAGAFSMAGGEYVSVSTQSDTEKAAVELQKERLRTHFQEEKEAVCHFYTNHGMDPAIAQEVAEDQMAKKPLEITLQQKYGLEVGKYTNPWHAGISSFISFTIGSILPLIAILVMPESWEILGTVLSVTVSLFLTGLVSARLGKAPAPRAILRNILVGLLTMVVTYGIGLLLNV